MITAHQAENGGWGFIGPFYSGGLMVATRNSANRVVVIEGEE